MEFSIVKKGYAPKEVDAYIAAVKREYESTILKQRDRIKEMLREKEAADKELAAHREKSSQIGKAIVSAVAKAAEIERLSRIKYSQEIARLKAFHEKWTKYYDKILDEYPLDARLAAAEKERPTKDYADRSPSGFSFEEALNPTEDLESILKDLGL